MTQIGKSNVKWSEIRDALNKNGGSVSNKAEDAFKVSSKYQKWSLRKPVGNDGDFYSPDSDSEWYVAKNGDYGITIPEYLASQVETFISDVSSIDNMDDLWTLDVPDGKVKINENIFNPNEPYRLGDFCLHDTDAKIANEAYIFPSNNNHPQGGAVNVSCYFYDNWEKNLLNGKRMWLDLRDLLKYENGTFSTDWYFGFIADGTSRYYRSLDSGTKLSIINGYENQLLAYINTTGAGTWNIYPVLFKNKITDSSAASDFVPLPFRKLKVVVVPLNEFYGFSTTINSITYDSIDSTPWLNVNMTFNNEWGGTWNTSYETANGNKSNYYCFSVHRSYVNDDYPDNEIRRILPKEYSNIELKGGETNFDISFQYTIPKINESDNLEYCNINGNKVYFRYDIQAEMVCNSIDGTFYVYSGFFNNKMAQNGSFIDYSNS